jgi:hypothetical protein
MKITPLTREQHEDVARLLKEAIDRLGAAFEIVSRAKGAYYTDSCLQLTKQIRSKLVEPLRNHWESSGFPPEDDPYSDRH